MKIKNWIVVVEKFKEDEMYILLKKMVVRLGMLYVKMEVFILESFVEKVFCDWVVDWIFFLYKLILLIEKNDNKMIEKYCN